LADLGVTGGTGGGNGVRLGVADELDVVMVVFVFGIAPEVEAVGDDGVVLGFDELADDVDEEGRAALAEVLALGVLIVVEGVGGGAGGAVGGLAEGTLALIGCGWSEMNLSAVVIVYQLNLNSGTVPGSPVRSW
jgi:hypothetical protein